MKIYQLVLTPIFDKVYASYKSTSEVMDAIVESGTLLTVNVHVRNTSDIAPELVEFSVSSQIFRYLFVTPLIEDEIKHEIVDFSIVTSSGPSEPFVLIMALWSFLSIHLLVSHQNFLL